MDTWTLVKQDIDRRNKFGFEKYGKYLTPDTSEDMLQHLYEELLDATVYIKTLIEKRNKIYGRYLHKKRSDDSNIKETTGVGSHHEGTSSSTCSSGGNANNGYASCGCPSSQWIYKWSIGK